MPDAEFWRWKEFEHELEKRLIEAPLFPIYEDTVAERPPRPSLTLAEAAKALGITRNALTVRLHRRPTALPYGSCKTREGWKIYEEDLPALRQNEGQ
jgi:hypothetical protein